MDAPIDDVGRNMATVPRGRAAVSLLANIQVDYYGTLTPLNQVASVHAPEPQMLTVQPWDQTQVANIKKAIRSAAHDVNPSNNCRLGQLTIPHRTPEPHDAPPLTVHPHS